jgi:phenylacetate-CoA ligase
MRRMARITGRSDDMLIIRGVNVFPTQIEELITKQPRLSPHYVLEVRREGRLDELAVIVEVRQEARAATEAERAAEAQQLEHHIKSYIGISAEVRVVEPGKVERSQGKAKRVIDLRPKG